MSLHGVVKPQQMALHFGWTAADVTDFIRRSTGKDISLIITDNSTSLLSFRKDGVRVLLRLHRMFLAAGEEVLKEIADFIENSRMRTPLTRTFIRENRDLLKKLPPRNIRPRTGGRNHDLLEIYESVNRRYFGRSVDAVITWGKGSASRAVRRRTLGSFSSSANTIRINPILDKKSVPRFFVEFVVYHEMLHAHMGCSGGEGRRRFHTREFRSRESLFERYQQALAWEKNYFGSPGRNC